MWLGKEPPEPRRPVRLRDEVEPPAEQLLALEVDVDVEAPQRVLGVMKLTVKAEGGHYTFVEAQSDQMGESRLDRNVKRFFVTLHRIEDPRHELEAAY